jgi:hypothetical protein
LVVDWLQGRAVHIEWYHRSLLVAPDEGALAASTNHSPAQAEAKAAARIVFTQTVHAAAAALADQLLKAIAKALSGSKSTTEEASSRGTSSQVASNCECGIFQTNSSAPASVNRT